MKKIKIRFIERGNPAKDYLIQKKTWLGWKYISYWQFGGFGDYVDTLFCKDTKEELLATVLECHYSTDKRFVEVIEYPTIRRY